MKKQGISAVKIGAAYIGTVVGAGFATGQEILQFFAGFGINGVWGIAISTALFVVFGIIIMEIGFEVAAESHVDILSRIGGKMFTLVMDRMISFFMFASLTAMMAGTGALFTQQLGLSGVLGGVVMAVITAATVLAGFSGVVSSISAVVPFLLVSVVGISLFSINQNPPELSTIAVQSGNPFLSNWLLSAVLYASYNIIMSVAVLGSLGAAARDKRALRRGALLGGGGLGLASLMICLALSGASSDTRALEVPLAHIAGKISPFVQFAFSLVLIAEVYTTAVGSLYGISARIGGGERSAKKKTAVIGVTAGAVLAGMMGFSNIVKYLYPMVGYFGIILLVRLTFSKLRRVGQDKF